MKNTLLRYLLLMLVLFSSLMQLYSCDGKSGTDPDNPGGDKPGEETQVFKRSTVIQNFVEYRNGNFPLIISVPHGGGESDNSFTVRTQENTADPEFATVRDMYTMELAHLIDSMLHARTGKYAHVVICRLRRTYVDMNRQRQYAVPQGSRQEGVYDLYHSRMQNTRNLVTIESGRGLVLDIHGHAHEIQQVELGYSLSRSELNMSDSELMNGNYASESSIYSLSKNNKLGKTFVEMLRGAYSFGNFLAARNVPCIPHSANPSPGTNSYFSGGYITTTYGSSGSGGGTVDAIQMEFDSTARSAEQRKDYASNVVDAILQFLDTNYQFK